MSDALSIAALGVAAVGGGSSVYAVVISRRALALEQSKTEPRIEIVRGHATAHKNIPRIQFLDEPIKPDPLFYELTVNVINSGETTEYVHTLLVETATTGEGCDYSPDEDQELKAHSRWSHVADAAGLPESDDGWVAIVRLANGREYRSSLIELDDVLRAGVTEHNSNL